MLRTSKQDSFAEKMKERFTVEVEKFVKNYIEHAIHFTVNFDTELQLTAKHSVR